MGLAAADSCIWCRHSAWWRISMTPICSASRTWRLLACMLGAFACLNARKFEPGGWADRAGGGGQGVPVHGDRLPDLSAVLEGDGFDDPRALTLDDGGSCRCRSGGSPAPSRTWEPGRWAWFSATTKAGSPSAPSEVSATRTSRSWPSPTACSAPIPADGEARDGWKVNIANLDFATVNKLILMSALILGGLYVGLMPKKANRNQATSRAIEYALLILAHL